MTNADFILIDIKPQKFPADQFRRLVKNAMDNSLVQELLRKHQWLDANAFHGAVLSAMIAEGADMSHSFRNEAAVGRVVRSLLEADEAGPKLDRVVDRGPEAGYHFKTSLCSVKPSVKTPT